MIEFAESLIASSDYLTRACADIADFCDPEEPSPFGLHGYIGRQIAVGYHDIPEQERHFIFSLIEGGLLSSDRDVDTAVATGLVESLVNRAEMIEGLWPDIEASLEPETRLYADAYRSFGDTARPAKQG